MAPNLPETNSAPHEESPTAVISAFIELLSKEDIDAVTLMANATALIARLQSFS